jgi:hypothetical protein
MANETRRLDEPVVRRTPHPARPADRTSDLARIIRRALRNPGSDTPLSQAIRTAVAQATPNVPATASEDEALRIRQVALRMDALLTQRAVARPRRSPHLETVHN